MLNKIKVELDNKRIEEVFKNDDELEDFKKWCLKYQYKIISIEKVMPMQTDENTKTIFKFFDLLRKEFDIEDKPVPAKDSVGIYDLPLFNFEHNNKTYLVEIEVYHKSAKELGNSIWIHGTSTSFDDEVVIILGITSINLIVDFKIIVGIINKLVTEENINYIKQSWVRFRNNGDPLFSSINIKKWDGILDREDNTYYIQNKIEKPTVIARVDNWGYPTVEKGYYGLQNDIYNGWVFEKVIPINKKKYNNPEEANKDMRLIANNFKNYLETYGIEKLENKIREIKKLDKNKVFHERLEAIETENGWIVREYDWKKWQFTI